MINSCFIPFPTLRTDRLVLRRLGAQDKNEIFRLRTDDQVNKYLDRSRARSLDEAGAFIELIDNNLTSGRSIMWAITVKDDTNLVGTICFWNIADETAEAEIGFELLPDFQGKNIMQEALPAVIDYGFSKMHLAAILAGTHAENARSASLLTRNGFIKKTVGNKECATENLVEYILTGS
jgi:ribosomal-protein-alanine N-acetyltransferase